MNKTAKVYKLLFERFGQQHWWPAESVFEVVVGALLMQQTSWRNVEKSIANLKRNGMLEPARLATARVEDLGELVRPAGLHRTKPARIRDFSRQIVDTRGGDVMAFLNRDAGQLRKEMLSMKGVGPETADSILLYAAGVPVFVVDAYTKRLCERICLMKRLDYESIQEYFTKNLPEDVELYKEFHALIVRHAKETCRIKPMCGGCVLGRWCGYNKR